MRGFLLLFRRDLQQRWMLFVASLAMGLFILGVPFLPGSRQAPAELRGAAGLVAALSWSAVLALLLGASIFTRDLTEHRLAFDFRLPVRPSAIWAARLLAASVTIALAAGLLLAPPAAAGMDWTGAAAGVDVLLGLGISSSSKGVVSLAPVALLALLLLANAIALAARSRQAWIACDLLSVAILVSAGAYGWHLLAVWQAEHMIWRTTLSFAALMLMGLCLASFFQILAGRTENERAHASQSVTLLLFACLSAAALVGFDQWCVKPQLSSLRGERVAAVGLGPDWVGLVGSPKRDERLFARFLVQPNRGRTIRLGPGEIQDQTADAKCSREASRIAWLERDDSSGTTVRLHVLDAMAPGSTPVATGITWRLPIGGWAISPEGEVVASLQYSPDSIGPRRIVVESIATGGTEASLLVSGCTNDGPLLFLNRNELVAACGERHEIFDSGLWSGAFRINLPTRSVSTFAPGVRLVDMSGVPRIPGPEGPSRIPVWATVEIDPEFEGPIATNSILFTDNGRVLWFNPVSRRRQALLQEEQYDPRYLRGWSVNECRGAACRKSN